MEKKYGDLPEAQSSKKVNNKNQLIYIIASVCVFIGAIGTGMIPDILRLVGLVLMIVILVKTIKNRKK